MSTIVGLVLRHVLTSAGGALATKGIILATEVDTVVGALLVLAGVVQSYIEKKQRRSL